jgi:hypothetical protein
MLEKSQSIAASSIVEKSLDSHWHKTAGVNIIRVPTASTVFSGKAEELIR